MTAKLAAIYWPGYNSDDPGSIGRENAKILSQPEWRYRAPFYSVTTESGDLAFAYNQAKMDQEIAYAVQAGISHWAYLMYTTGAGETPAEGFGGTEVAFNLYISSTNKSTLKLAMMHQPFVMGAPGNYTTEVNTIAALMVESWYATVTISATVRPLLYIFIPTVTFDASTGVWQGAGAAFGTMLAALRARVILLGGNDPYIVIVGGGSVSAWNTILSETGADCCSSYSSGNANAVRGPMANLISNMEACWPSASVWPTGNNLIPTVMMGWDPRPNLSRPASFYPSALPKGPVANYVEPSNAEIYNHILNAKTFIEANTSRCPSEFMLAYAWSEFLEGGWFCPTLGMIDDENVTVRLSASAGALV